MDEHSTSGANTDPEHISPVQPDSSLSAYDRVPAIPPRPQLKPKEQSSPWAQADSRTLKYGLWLAIIGIVLNVLGNLIASWIQQGVLRNIFAPITIGSIVSLTVLGVVIVYRMQQGQAGIKNILEAAMIFSVFGLLSGWILAGALPLFTNPTLTTDPEPAFIRSAELKRLYSNLETRPIIIDVREPEDFAEEHIAGAISIWALDVFTDHDPGRFPFPKDKLIVLYCNCEEELFSVRVAQLMHYEYGFRLEYLRVLNDGLPAWKIVDGPIDRSSTSSPTSVP